MSVRIQDIRNIGISAHVDAGKTTLAERILFYAGRIRAIHDVKGRDGVGAHLDHDGLEKDKGITINAAATSVRWRGASVHIVDTPGHVDFTVEVERALRVLDGAILVLSAVAGVQAQTVTVERQMARYGVPRIAFVNKCDLAGADPGAVVEQLQERLDVHAVLVQWPLGLESDHRGVIDLLTREAVTFGGDHGEQVHRQPIELDEAAQAARTTLLEAAALFDDDLLQVVLDDGEPELDQVRRALAEGTRRRELVPVFVGAARSNLGVQPLMDGVVDYLPSPDQRTFEATDPDTEEPVALRGDPSEPVLAYAFKLQETDHGQLTWLRIYRGVLTGGQALADAQTRQKQRVRRLFQIDAGQLLPVEQAGTGEIVAAVGPDVASGRTLSDPAHRLVIGQMHVPEPVVRRAVHLVDGDLDRLGRGLARLTREDPTLRVITDDETGQTVLLGMGELHLEVVAHRLAERFGAQIRLGRPLVAERQALTRAVDFDFLFKRQKGGPGLYARIAGRVAPADTFTFEWQVVGGAIPSTFRAATERGFRLALEGSDPLVIGAHVVITDGGTHPNDSSDLAFELGARMAFRDVLQRAEPVHLEPWMRVVAEGPSDRHGVLVQSLLSRRGRILDAEPGRVEAEVPLSQMFGYATALRSATSGSGAFSMTFDRFAPA